MPRTIPAAIVAGGRGVRMAPATDHTPKPMLEVGGKPLLEHLVLWLKDSGISEAFMCLGYKARNIMDYFQDGSRWGMKIRYQVEKTPRGTAGAVRDLLPKIGEDILVVYGDLYVSMNLGRLLDFHFSHAAAATIVLCETDHPQDSDLARVDGDRITGFYRARSGKPSGNLGLAAVWVLRRRLLDMVPADGPSDFGRDVFPKALSLGETLMAYRTKETLEDIGTPERREAFLRRLKTA